MSHTLFKHFLMFMIYIYKKGVVYQMLTDSQDNNYFIRTSLIDDMFNRFVQSNTHITVLVNPSLADQLEFRPAEPNTDNLGTVLNAGFNLQRAANNQNCDQCVQPGERCGCNLE